MADVIIVVTVFLSAAVGGLYWCCRHMRRHWADDYPCPACDKQLPDPPDQCPSCGWKRKRFGNDDDHKLDFDAFEEPFPNPVKLRAVGPDEVEIDIFDSDDTEAEAVVEQLQARGIPARLVPGPAIRIPKMGEKVYWHVLVWSGDEPVAREYLQSVQRRD